MFDLRVPQSLLECQRWFAKTITQPLQEDQKLAEEWRDGAYQHILPNSHLTSLERVEIYHQQYWWRLLDCLHKNFPMVTVLYGYESFNRGIGVPYLTEHPASHWALCRLGETLPVWLREKEFPQLTVEAAEIDRASGESFFIGAHPPLEAEEIASGEILERRLRLQPYVHLFALEEDLFTLREELLKKKVEEWKGCTFPEYAKKRGYFAIYRSAENLVKWAPLSATEYHILKKIGEGISIQEICEQMEEEGVDGEVQELFPFWFHQWISLNWFTLY